MNVKVAAGGGVSFRYYVLALKSEYLGTEVHFKLPTDEYMRLMRAIGCTEDQVDPETEGAEAHHDCQKVKDYFERLALLFNTGERSGLI